MRIEQEKVEMFMRMIGDPIVDKPELGNYADGMRRYALMKEELEEYRLALENGDLVGVADALADLEYTVLGTSSHHGMELLSLFDEVHRSNMTKTPVDHSNPEYARLKRFKLCEKGAKFSPPRIADILLVQSLDPKGYGHGV